MFQLIIIGFYLSFVSLVLYGFHRLFGMGVSGGIVLGIALMLAPFWDVFVTKGIMMNFNRQHAPLQEIIRTVEKPGSVLWLDDVWPGFDEYGRHWMVESYLDGVHLTNLALNGDDGKIYLYHATTEDFAKSEKLHPEFASINERVVLLENETNKIWKKHVAETEKANGDIFPWPKAREKYNNETRELKLKIKELKSRLKKLGYKNQRKQEIDQIFASPVVYDSPADLPPINYRINFQRLRLPGWQEEFIWCDEITIQDIHQNEEIAFSKRCLGYLVTLDKVLYYSTFGEFGGTCLGDKRAYEFDDKVVFGYARVSSSFESKRSRLDR